MRQALATLGVAMTLVVLTLVAGLAGTAAAATAKPDAHDRALALALAAKVSAFQDISSASGDSKVLDHCAYLKKHPNDAFAAVFAILPALLAIVVNEYRTQLTDVSTTIAGMHPDSPLFSQWLTAEGQDIDLILRFDNHGKKVDLCAAAQLMLSKTATAAQIKRVLGLDPALIGLLFSKQATAISNTISKLNPQMRTFLLAAGVARKDAVQLTSNT